MLRFIVAAVLVALTGGSAWSQQDVRIATFNIQNFGPKKAANTKIIGYLATIVRKFDIIAIQELSDAHGKVPGLFLKAINADGHHYEMLLSERTGQQPDDKTAQEQYAFYFDNDRIEALDQGALFDDSKNDLFQREPFTAHFRAKGSPLTFTITTIHTQPRRAVAEIDSLFVVYNDVAAHYGNEKNHIVLGDFNGSCSYAKPAQLKPLKIRGAAFYWVVPDSADTTVSPTTSCAYDRIILDMPLKARFAQWGVASWFKDKTISDHWPVWVSLKASTP